MTMLAALLALAAAPGAAEDYRIANPRAIELFERDSALMRWALRAFDSDGDGHLSIREADRAAQAFKAIADGDSDGRVTPTEYRAARDFIRARWAVR